MRRTLLPLCVAVLFVAVVLVGGCAPPFGSRHWPQSRESRPTLVFDLDADVTQPSSFWDQPFPADARTLQNGAPDVRGLPNPFGVGFVDLARASVMRDVDALGPGFSPMSVISFRFDRPVPPRPIVPLSTTKPTSGLQLIDLSPGRLGQRVIVDSHITTSADVARPSSLLQFAPLTGVSLLPGTYAAVVLRDLDDDDLIDLDPSPVVRGLLADAPSTTNQRWHQSLAPLREQLTALGINANDIAAATVFSVGDPTARITRFVQQARAEPPPPLVSLARGRAEVNTSSSTFTELQGVLRQPQHQSGEPPHFSETGAFVVDEHGALVVTRHEDAPFVVAVPKGKMPATGWPLLLYVHGTGGNAVQVTDRGRRARPGAPVVPGQGMSGWLAPHGVATASIAGPYSPDRIGWRALDGYGAYVFMNPPAMRDNFGQMLIEHARFIALLESLAVDAALLPEVDASAAPDGKVHFDVRLVGGHSLGSYLSGMIAGILPEFDGVILSGAGGTWVEFAFGPKDPIDLQGLIELAALPPGQHLDRFHPFIDIFETGVAAADNTLFTRHILKHPRPGAHVPHVLVIEGEPDAQVPTGLQRALVRSVGVDLVGHDTGRTSLQRLLPGLHAIGRTPLPSPASLNLSINGTHLAGRSPPTPQTVRLDDKTAKPVFSSSLSDQRTGVVVRYAEDGLLDGHNVLFQRDDTRAMFVAFVSDVVAGRAPVVHGP